MERSAYRRLVLHGHPINRHAYFELADVQDVAAWAETLLQEKPDGRQEGFCRASNGYLAKLYNAGSRSVSRWVAELVEAGFITVDAAVNQHGQRKIYVAGCASPKVAGQNWRPDQYK